jgi:hypothetical protein
MLAFLPFDEPGTGSTPAQFHEHEVIPGIPEFVRGLGASGPWVILEFILTSDSVLDGLSPREGLLQGAKCTRA